jgi:putative transposase
MNSQEAVDAMMEGRNLRFTLTSIITSYLHDDYSSWSGFVSLDTAGTGHLYQGRFESFPMPSDEHFLTVCRYVERNALRADLVERAQDWRWGSLWARRASPEPDRPALSPWPIERPRDWTARVNRPFGPAEEEAVQRSLRRGQPFGMDTWRAEVAARLGLESTFRPRGRPRKRSEHGS